MFGLLREQFQSRPSSGNVSEPRAEKRKAEATGIAEVGDINPDSPSILEDENNGTDETLIENTSTIPASTSTTRTFVHSNEFQKKKVGKINYTS